MLECLLPLRLAKQATAAPRDGFTRQTFNRRATNRTGRRKLNRSAVLGISSLSHHADDLRNDVAGAPHDDGIADHDPQTLDLIGIVQRCI